MAETEGGGGGAESVTTVTSQIDGATTVQACVDLMTKLATMMRTDAQLSVPLETAGIMWNKSADAVNAAHLQLHSVTQTLLQDWGSPDAEMFKQNRAVTEASLSRSYDGMVPVPGVLNALAGQIRTTASTVETQVDALNKLVETYKSSHPVRQSPANFESGWAKKARVPLHAAGDAMIGLADKFGVAGSFLTTDAAQLKWEGPGGGNAAPTTNAPGSTPSVPSSPGGPTGADPAATDPGGQQAGADQQGGAQDAGAGGTDGAGGASSAGSGSVPEAPGGGTGLAGMPAGSTMVPRFEGSLPNVATVSPTHTPVVPPMSTLPVGGVPGGYAGGAGAGKVPGGGIGGGGLPGVPGGGGSQKGGVDSQLPRAVPETGATQGPLSGGRAPAAPSGLASGAGAAAGQGGGGMPPMMPPMAGAAGAGSNKAGRPGNGMIAPGNRRRDRQQGDTPGVPVGLRGRAGKDLPGAFPAVPVNTRRRKEKTEAANTLQLLDEDLWKVEATDAKAAPPAPHQQRRPTN